MSEYELADLFNSHVQTVITIFMAFVSTTSAFLIVTYLAAKEFSSFLTRVVVALYTISSLMLIGITQRQTQVIVGLRGEMEGVATWHPAVYEPEWIMPTAFSSVVIVMGLFMMGALWFFAFTRKAGRNMEHRHGVHDERS